MVGGGFTGASGGRLSPTSQGSRSGISQDREEFESRLEDMADTCQKGVDVLAQASCIFLNISPFTFFTFPKIELIYRVHKTVLQIPSY